MTGEIPSMDPTRQADSSSGFWLSHLYEGLMARDPDGNPVPGAAEKVEVSPDGRLYSFTLRGNGKWHDGKPVTAADFEFAFRRLVDPGFASHYAFIATTAGIENAQDIVDGKRKPADLGVKAVGENRLEIRLSAPVPYFLSLMSFSTFYPVRSDLVARFGDAFGAKAESVIGNGPFRLVRWQQGSSLRVERAPTYWNAAAVRLQALETPVFSHEISTNYNLFATGTLDVILLDKEHLVLAQKERRPLKTFSGGDMYWIEMNQRTGGLFTAQRLRQALRLGLDRGEYVNRIVALPGTQPAFGAVPAYIPGSRRGLTFRAENPLRWKDGDLAGAQAEVRAWLKETGQSKVPSFTLLTAEGTPQDHAEYLQDRLTRIFSTEVKLERVPFKVRLQRSRDGQFDVVWGSWVPDYLDASTFLEVFQSDNANNKGQYRDAAFDALLAKAQTERDAKQRIVTLGKAERRLLLDTAGVVPFYSQVKVYLVAPGLEGVARQAIGGTLDFRAAHWRK